MSRMDVFVFSPTLQLYQYCFSPFPVSGRGKNLPKKRYRPLVSIRQVYSYLNLTDCVFDSGLEIVGYSED